MWNSEDIVMMQKFMQIANRGSRINGTEVTELYNRIFNKQLRPTNCGSCISQRYRELKTSYNLFQEELKKQEEKAKALEVLDEFLTPTEYIEEAYIPTKEEVLMDDDEPELPKKKRKKKGE